jgi:hypothetical protein
MLNTSMPADSITLRDIHLPDAISWWPLAPGWWALLGISCIAIATLFLWRAIEKKKRIKKAALNELEIIRNSYQQNLNSSALARSTSTLLRRVCLSYYPNTEVLGMTGDQWLSYLDSTTDKKGFKSEQGNILATAPYVPERKCPHFDAEVLLALSEAWIQAQPRKGAHT